jgi:hypothetical protein
MSDLFLHRDARFAWTGKLRLTLERTWNYTLPRVCFIGHNPSTGSHLVDDPTVHRSMKFSRSWGYGGCTWVNLYPVVTPDPAECRRWADWENNGPDWYVRDALQHNVGVVAETAKSAGLVLACWGAIAQDEDWIEHVIEEITYGDAPWPDIHVLGLTQSGAPIHPLARGKHRVPDTAMPVIWRKGAA